MRVSPSQNELSDSSTSQVTSMPSDSPTFQVASVVFGVRHGLTIVARTDPHLVRQWFPFPLAVVGSELVFQFNFTVLTSPIHVDYHNATVLVPATLGDWEGLYFARVYEGSAQSAMLSIWGREIWGFPKVAADVAVSRDDTSARAGMSAAHGCARANVEVEFTELTSTVQPETRVSVFCRKMIPRSDGRGYDVNRLVLVPVANPSEHHLAARVIECDIKMDIGGNEIAVPIEDGTTAYWYDQEPGLVLELGRDVHDYTVG